MAPKTVPQSCTVLVIGGGPAGSYAAAALSREGIDTVVMEADKFPRYHIGESTLPSLRHFFKFIDFYDTFNEHGFYHKNGAVFRLAQGQPDAYTDFLDALGPDGYAWNLVRSEFDDMLFRHAGACGATILDETKINEIQFEPSGSWMCQESATNAHSAKPVSATWVRKDGTSGAIKFDYLIDASGRQGILSTKYLKNRRFNDNFKNVANWSYWKSDNVYAPGTHMEGSPYFEALDDGSGWAWFMPLHDGTRSVGIVQDQKIAVAQKRELGSTSTLNFYNHTLQKAPKTMDLLSGAEMVADVRSASDWSYTASTYHLPHSRICGDAGSFIDPLFSSGIHLAVTGGLSAALTIATSLKGDHDERVAGEWHSKKTIESYTRFFLAVSSATKQIRQQHEPIIQDMDEQGFQRAFDLFRPIIQGTVDATSNGTVTRTEISRILEFCFKAFAYVPQAQKDALFEKLKKLGVESDTSGKELEVELDEIQGKLTADELRTLETLRSRRMIREDPFEIDSFTLDTIDGLGPNLLRGKLGLVKAEEPKINRTHFYSPKFLDGKDPAIREGSVHLPTSKFNLASW